jgi:PKD repeat protein
VNARQESAFQAREDFVTRMIAQICRVGIVFLSFALVPSLCESQYIEADLSDSADRPGITRSHASAAACSYSINPSSVEFGPAGGETAVTVNTQSGCSWTATSTTPWITVISPTGAYYGTGTLRFRASANTGPYRTGSIVAGGKGLVVNQRPPYVPENFTMSTSRPEIGEVVTFSVDPILEVESWDFGEANCEGSDPFVNCYFQTPGACNTYQWTYPSSGEKSVTMRLTDGRSKTKNPVVANSGECCLVDDRPDASFQMSADEIFAGETVSFVDTSSKITLKKALSFSWTPANPDIGDTVVFNLEGVVGEVDTATWNFGETGCDGLSAVQQCVGLYSDCTTMGFAFASGGSKTVSVDVVIDGAPTETVGPEIVTVSPAGQCGGGCTYTLDPGAASFPPGGGSDFFYVTTTSECDWSASTTSGFISVTSGEGPGFGRVDYTVSANYSGSTRSGIILVNGEGSGKNFHIHQAGETGNTSPIDWRWLITQIADGYGDPVGEDVYSSTSQNISYRFEKPGFYRVSLTASNCAGSDTSIRYVDVLDAPIENFVVASAISSGGANNTRWESDFRFHNPCGETLDVNLVYQPDNQDNWRR